MEECTCLTVKQYLSDIVNFEITDGALEAILAKRGVSGAMPFHEAEERDVDLCKADVYVWFCTSPTKKGSVSDSDNGWSHSEGGHTLSQRDRRYLLTLANDIYEKYDEKKVLSSGFRIKNHGIKHCNYDLDGKSC